MRAPLQPRQPLLYALSLGGALAFWIFLDRWGRGLRGLSMRWGYASVVGLLAATLLTATAATFLELGQFVTRDMLRFVLSDPLYFVDFAQDLLAGPGALIYLVLVGGMIFIWRPRARMEPVGGMAGSVGIGLLAVGMLVGAGATGKGFHHRMESTFLWAIPEAVADGFGERERLRPAQRVALEGLSAEERSSWDVLWIYNESLAAESLFALDGEPARAEFSMPLLQGWLEQEADRAVVFGRAYTNSGATDVSIPSLFTGVGPYESVELLHEVPLPWHWARAAGLGSILVTPQRYSWANFDSFFFSSGPDVVHSASTLGAPIVNDTGVDDMVAAKKLVEELRGLPADEPMLVLYGTNGAHYPFQDWSEYLELPGGLSRHERALRIVDHGIWEVLQELERSGRLERTIVMMTSDHGELEERRHLARLNSFYDEIARVPVFIRLPQGLVDERPQWLEALRENQGQIVQNVDLLPTMVELLGLGEVGENQKILERLSGQSLLQPLREDRMVVMLNTNDIRRWETEGFGLFFDRDMRFVFSTIEGPQLFDVSRDPEQVEDLWPQVDEVTRERILEQIRGSRHLERIFAEGGMAGF